MDDQPPRESGLELRVRHTSDDEPKETLDDLARRREHQRRVLTERERAERWPCG
jgi:hypothetical protein